jgi:hypothetical protein
LLTLTLLGITSGCAGFRGATRVTVIDSSADWVKLGPGVKGQVYLWDHAAKAWSLQSKTMVLPEGWVAGPDK